MGSPPHPRRAESITSVAKEPSTETVLRVGRALRGSGITSVAKEPSTETPLPPSFLAAGGITSVAKEPSTETRSSTARSTANSVSLLLPKSHPLKQGVAQRVPNVRWVSLLLPKSHPLKLEGRLLLDVRQRVSLLLPKSHPLKRGIGAGRQGFRLYHFCCQRAIH